MADTLVQFKINETSKLEAERICNNCGIDLESYLRMCIARLISNNGIPFDMVIDDKPSNGINALREMQRISEEMEIQK